jgi:hypothetical protein
LNNLAETYRQLRDYKRSEPLPVQAKAIRKKMLLDKKHSDYIESLNAFSLLYQQIRDYKQAEQIHLEAKAVTGGSRTTKSPLRITSETHT